LARRKAIARELPRGSGNFKDQTAATTSAGRRASGFRTSVPFLPPSPCRRSNGTSARNPSSVPLLSEYRPFDYWRARLAGYARPRRIRRAELPARSTESGVSLIIPSRNGRGLLAAQLPGITRDLADIQAEVIVIDNGSDDGTSEWLRAGYPEIQPDVSAQPLSFARAVNRGIARSRFSHICLFNNDMLIEPGFFIALRRPFERIRDLFCATAQIRFPAGVRREETGKAVMAQSHPADFPLRCDEPLPGEDGTPVLYGSGGCSLYDAAKLRALGGFDESYEPAYVEDLDLGYRAWQRAWPSVYVAGAVVEHRHRATTRRYYSEEQLEAVLEVNYLRFLAQAVADRAVFARLWKQAVDRLALLGSKPPARHALRQAAKIARSGGPVVMPSFGEELFLALTNGCAAVFRGTGQGVAIESVERLSPPPAEMLNNYSEVMLVAAPRNSLAFHGAVRFREMAHSG
jgi:O-antigen biosynthesis protein